MVIKDESTIIKIRTITCHDVYNFGASLQAYALMKYLQDLGNNVEIINYKPAYMNFSLWAIGEKWRKNIVMRLLFYSYVVPRRIILKSRRRKFDQFTQNMLNITSKIYHSNDELKIDPPIADIYIAGSDQIWNTSHYNGRDPAFYLDFATTGAIRASYAASFSVSEIPPELINFVRSKLKKFDAISVREKSGLRILDTLNIKGGVLVLDPVFLLDIKRWNQLCSFIPEERYILVYDQENNPHIKKSAELLAKNMGIKIYAIKSLYPMSYAHKKIVNVGPREFLGLIKNCDVCLTNSFHGTAFSLIFQKEFYTFKRTHEKVNSRMVDLLEMVQLSDRIIDHCEAIYDVQRINYADINERIEERLQFSKVYVNGILTRIKSNAE